MLHGFAGAKQLTPAAVTVTIKSRVVVVKGERGTLRRDFRHVDCDLRLINGGRAIKVEIWFGTSKKLACMRTVCSHIENLFTGVTKVRSIASAVGGCQWVERGSGRKWRA